MDKKESSKDFELIKVIFAIPFFMFIFYEIYSMNKESTINFVKDIKIEDVKSIKFFNVGERRLEPYNIKLSKYSLEKTITNKKDIKKLLNILNKNNNIGKMKGKTINHYLMLIDLQPLSIVINIYDLGYTVVCFKYKQIALDNFKRVRLPGIFGNKKLKSVLKELNLPNWKNKDK